MLRKINWRKGNSDMIGLTITLLGLVGFFCLFVQILITCLGMMNMEDAVFEISRRLVVCESLDDADDDNNANKVADELVEEYFRDSTVITDVSAYVSMADTRSGDDWEKGNFAILYIRGVPKGLIKYPYITVQYTFMIERDGT